MKLKLMIMTSVTAVLLSVTSAFALTVTVGPIGQAAFDSFGPTGPSQSLDLGGGAFSVARDTPSGNLSGIYRSPWDTYVNAGNKTDKTIAENTKFYTTGPTGTGNIVNGAPNTPNPALLVFGSVQNSLTFLWGSVDSYNFLTFRDSNGSLIETVNGTTVIGLGAPARLSAARVLINGFTNGFSQVEFFSKDFNAFEFSNIEVVSSGISVVPLPAALPLYGTGLAIMGFIGWRRKRKTIKAA